MNKKKDKVIIHINPSPSDERCECCGRHINELKPFGGPGDPLVGNFKGAVLVKIFRSLAPHLTEKQMKEYRKKYGEEATEFYDEAQDTVGASWECRDCIILGEKEYFEKLEKLLKGEKTNE